MQNQSSTSVSHKDFKQFLVKAMQRINFFVSFLCLCIYMWITVFHTFNNNISKGSVTFNNFLLLHLHKADWTCPITLLQLLQKIPSSFCNSNGRLSAWWIKVLTVSIQNLIELSQSGLWSPPWKWTFIKGKYSVKCKHNTNNQKVH